MVKHAGSNSDDHAVEHCRVGSEAIARALAAALAKERMPVYELSPKFVRNPRSRKVDRYLRVFVERV
jgi:hypothetical protein